MLCFHLFFSEIHGLFPSDRSQFEGLLPYIFDGSTPTALLLVLLEHLTGQLISPLQLAEG